MSSGRRKNGKINEVKVKVTNDAGAKPVEGTAQLAEEANALRGTLNFLSARIDQLAANMEKAKLRDYVNLMQKPWKIILNNLISGLARGIGYAIGFSFFAATIVYVLQWIGALNLPIVGDYIADIVRVVQRQLEIKPHS
ncbi:DUF5665 domain-containing protein [Cohnella yongneupensis]|uniref:DUF5665 domain-containing protein n=1 Tax=Cohnella yongneupensis TaxID=425006 RepID=A0ABW0R4Q7_9BACL